MKLFKEKLFVVVAALLSIVGIFLMFCPFVKFSASSSFIGSSSSAFSGFAFAFGNQSVKLSVGVLFIFILAIVSFLLACADVFVENKMFNLAFEGLAALMLLVAGIMCFCVIPMTGFAFGFDYGDLANAKTSLGVGAIFDGILFLVAAIAAGVQTAKALKK